MGAFLLLAANRSSFKSICDSGDAGIQTINHNMINGRFRYFTLSHQLPLL